MDDLINILDFELCKNIHTLQNYQVIIWGGAEKGRNVKRKLQQMGLQIQAFCDSAIEKWGKEYDGARVVSPYQLDRMLQETRRICIISCVSRENEIIKILQEYNKKAIPFVSYWGIKTACKLWEKAHLPEKERIEKYVLKHKFQNTAAEYLRQYDRAEEDNIWILQPGKTASSTLEVRFKTAGIPFMKQHTLRFPGHVLEEELKPVWEKTVHRRIQQKCKIIAAVREPLARDYSAFWQSFTDGLERAYLIPEFGNDIQQMYDHFTELILGGYSAAAEKTGYALPYTWRDEFEWFQEEIKAYFGIDVYACPFDTEAGYQIIEKKNVQLFLFKVEKMECIMPALCDFAGCGSLSAQNANKAENKIYHLAYKEFRKKVRLSAAYVNHYYEKNDYVNHFYTREERADFRKQWEENIRDDNIWADKKSRRL